MIHRHLKHVLEDFIKTDHRHVEIVDLQVLGAVISVVLLADLVDISESLHQLDKLIVDKLLIERTVF
jgi:hypothetical protein